MMKGFIEIIRKGNASPDLVAVDFIAIINPLDDGSAVFFKSLNREDYQESYNEVKALIAEAQK